MMKVRVKELCRLVRPMACERFGKRDGKFFIVIYDSKDQAHTVDVDREQVTSWLMEQPGAVSRFETPGEGTGSICTLLRSHPESRRSIMGIDAPGRG